MKIEKKKIIVLAILAVVLIGCAILVFNLNKPGISGKAISPIRQKITSVDSKAIEYLLVYLGAGRLHKNPIGFEKPIICVKVDGKEYLVIVSKIVEVTEKNCSKQDIEIITTSSEILNALNGNVKTYMKDSVWNDRTFIELIAGKVELFAKGYADLYYNFN